MALNFVNNIYEHYDFLSERIPKSKHQEFFSKRLRIILNNPQYYIYNSEVDINNYSSIYYFEHVKDELIMLISTQVNLEIREILLNKKKNFLLFNNTLYDTLILHNLKDLIIPFFIWLNYYKTNNLEKIKSNIEFLKQKGLKFKNIDELYNLGRGNTFFRLPYIQENNKEFLMYICSFMRQICPDLTYNNSVKSKSKKKRIGFISERLKNDSSVLRDRFKIIENIDRNKFEVFIIVTESEQLFNKTVKGNFAKDFYTKNKKEFIFLPYSVSESREIISFLSLNILVYCEIGMDYKPYLLSFARLAPIQINTWGHSETCGIDTIDYFISSKHYELEYDISNKYYSEKLILTDSLCTCYPNFDFLNNNFKIRKELGLNEESNIYCCLQASFKISEFMEDVINKILERDSKAIILLSIAFAPFCKTQLNRMTNKFNKNALRIKFYKILSLHEYLNLINISDIVLDTYPFGGCNSSLEAFYLNKPIVTIPTNKINGRFTKGFYDKMKIKECIVDSLDSYVKLCLKLTSNKFFYKEVIEKIKNNKYVLYEDQQSIYEWEDILYNLC